jgi:signal transduction histidine kinase
MNIKSLHIFIFLAIFFKYQTSFTQVTKAEASKMLTEDCTVEDLLHRFVDAKDNKSASSAAFNLGEYFWFQRNIVQAEKWLKQSIIYDPIPSNANNVINAHALLANVYHHISDFENANIYADKAMENIAKITNKKLMGNIYEVKGRISHSLGKTEESFRMFMRADSCNRVSPYPEIRALSVYVKLMIADCFSGQGQSDRAKAYLDSAYHYAVIYKDDIQQNICLQSLARWHKDQYNLPEAKKIFTALVKKATTGSSLLYTYQGLGDIAFAERLYSDALRYYRLSIHTAIQTNELYMLDVFYRDMAKVYLAMHELKSAKLYIDSSLVNARGNLSNKVQSLDLQAKIYTATGDYKSAWHSLLSKESIQDSLNRKNLAILTNKLDVVNRVKQKENKIEQLENDIKISEKLHHKNTIIKFLLFIILIFLIIAFILMRKRIIKKKMMAQKEAIAEEQNRISADLHDDIGATMSSIYVYSQLADKYFESNPDRSHEIIKKISAQTHATIEQMEDIIWSLKPDKGDGFTLQSRIQTFANNILKEHNISYAISIHPDVDGLQLNQKVKKNLLLIIKESINNIAKYSQASQVDINMSIENENLRLEIRDNGIGFEKTTVKKGNGLQNIVKRMTDLGGSLSINSAPGQGTQIKGVIHIASFRQ